MSTRLYEVAYVDLSVSGDRDFIEWLTQTFPSDLSTPHVITIDEFNEAVEKLTPKQKEEWKDDLEVISTRVEERGGVLEVEVN